MDVQLLMQQWDASLSGGRREALKKELAAYINGLLLDDFKKLVHILYRADVSEQKLKKILAENKEENAGELIAGMLIKRQEEKKASRQSFPPAKDIPEDERW
ncbi:MAG TPA: hypothetical protein VER36_11085 [Flavisolibacter sp.]|nr:hypothetical protein [Flavisolibacter sp.]